MGVNKILMLGTLFSLFFILMSSLSNSAPNGYEIIGNAVQWENSYGKLAVFPHTSYGLGVQRQYANITSYSAGSFDFAFEFENTITGKIYLWQNISHSVKIYDSGNITKYLDCPGVVNINYDFINSSWGWCNYTDANATEIYWEHYFDWYNTNASGIRIFWNITGIVGSHYEDQYWYDWSDKTGLFEYDTFNGRHFYWIKNVNFQENETKQVKWIYNTGINTNGKWQLWIKRNQDTIQEAISNGFYVKLDPWWDSNYPYRYPLNSNAPIVMPICLNETPDGSPLGICTLNASSIDGEKKYLYCIVANCTDGNWSIGNETDETNWENASSVTGLNPREVWGNDMVWNGHFETIDGGNRTNDSSIYINDGLLVNFNTDQPTTSKGVFGDGIAFSTNDHINISDPTENPELNLGNAGTLMAWANTTTASGAGRQIISKADVLSARNGYALEFHDNYCTLYLFSASAYKGCPGTSTLNDGILYHCVGKWNSTHMQIYVNGILEKTCANTLVPVSNVKDLWIGDDPSFPANVRAWEGNIDEPRIYNRTLSEEEIRFVYEDIINGTAYGVEETSNTTPVVSLYNITGSTTDTTPVIAGNFTDDDLIAKCYLLFNGTAYDVNATTVNATYTEFVVNESLVLDDYEVNLSCWDGENTGISSSIILTINYMDISIFSPTNTTYGATTIDLNVSYNPTPDFCEYELNGVNTTLMTGNYYQNDDTEDAYACWGNFSGSNPCSNAVDENWTTFAGGAFGIDDSEYVYENFTIPNNIISANWTYKIDCSGGGANWENWYWDYGNNSWEYINLITNCDTGDNGNYTEIIPNRGLNESILQIKTKVRKWGSDNLNYYEGMATWNISSCGNTTITAIEGSNSLTVYANNSKGLLNSSKVVFSVTISPSIDEVNVPSASLDPVEKSTTNVAINFTATGTYLDNSSAKFVLSKDATSYQDTSCSVTSIDSNTNRYNCDVNLNYYDPAGVWTVNVSINNNTGDGVVWNDTETITFNSLTALQTNSSSLSFGSFNRAGSLIIDTNQLENTGNVNLTTITVTGYDLRGVTDTSQFLYLSDSIFAVKQEGESYSDLINTTGVTVTNGVIDLYPSQYSNLDFKITPSNIPSINKAQSYQTETGLEWLVQV